MSETEREKLEGLIVSSAATAEFVANELEKLTKDALIDVDVIHLQVKRLRGQERVLMRVADALKAELR